MLNQYLVGPGIDNQLGFVKEKKGYFYHRDQVGSVVGISNDLGEVIYKIHYSSFGKVNKIFNEKNEEVSVGDLISKTGSELLFTGREYDSELKLYHYRARTYDPRTGRFLSQDPIGLAAGDTNFYRYVGNNPLMHNNPLIVVNSLKVANERKI